MYVYNIPFESTSKIDFLLTSVNCIMEYMLDVLVYAKLCSVDQQSMLKAWGIWLIDSRNALNSQLWT